jgi:hypothetical protein
MLSRDKAELFTDSEANFAFPCTILNNLKNNGVF